MNLQIELERENDGRWIADVPDLPGVMTYGQSRDEAIVHVQARGREQVTRKERAASCARRHGTTATP